ncbi:MAG: hypothetical protein N3F67_00655 [Acidilobaceae archaeon]|nr:hypothetical protein [Acidilobaceae archaeon]
MPVRLLVEASRSRSGLHAERKIALIVSSDGKVREASGETRPVKPLYAVGEAREVEAEVGEGELAVQVRLVRGPRGRVRGYVAVIDREGRELYRTVLRKRKVRPSRGDERYHRAVELALEYLSIAKYLRSYKPSSRSGSARPHEEG